MPLSFQPACQPVAHSGLPHTSSSHALGLLMTTTPMLLTWPRLPQRAFCEQSFVQSASGFPGLVTDTVSRRVFVDRTTVERTIDQLSLAYLQNDVDTTALKQDQATGLAELLRMPAGWFGGAAIRSQLVGPLSLSLFITDEQQRPLIYDPMLLEALAHHVSLRAGWLSRQFNSLVDDVIICLSEPFLDVFNNPFLPIDWNRGVELLELVFGNIEGCRGLSIGTMGIGQRERERERERGTPPASYWRPVLETSVELLLLDVYAHSSLLLEAADVLPNFLERPGYLVWGIVPTAPEDLARETVHTLVERVGRMLDTLAARGISREQLLQASLITTCTSLEHLSIAEAERALYLCFEVSNRLRSVYALN